MTDPAPPVPWLVVMVGAPCAGKSTLARLLSQELGYAVVENDVIRSRDFGIPTFSDAETEAVRATAVTEIGAALGTGASVVYDGTNLEGAWRSSLAERFATTAELLFVVVCADEDDELREIGCRQAKDPRVGETAWLPAYRRLALSMDPVGGLCLVVSSRRGVEDLLRLLARLARVATPHHTADESADTLQRR